LPQWPLIIVHAGTIAGWIMAGAASVRYGCDPLLRLVAGLGAIFGRSDRSRTDRALDVLGGSPADGRRKSQRGRTEAVPGDDPELSSDHEELMAVLGLCSPAISGLPTTSVGM
jgi:hypothetical protein